MRERLNKRSVHISDADLRGLLKRGFTVTDPRVPLTSAVAQKEKRSESGRRVDLNNLYVRSSWEANVCRYANWLQAYRQIDHWEYEPDEFEFPVKRGRGKFYKPDLKIWRTPTSFLYWEVKGWMDPISATKLKRMQKYYPQHEIVLFDQQRYYAEVYPLRDLLPGWESHGRI